MSYATIWIDRLAHDTALMGVILPDQFAGFRLRRPLGKPGGFGAVYEAERAGERVALKIFHAELLDDVELERFQREVRGLVKVRHPNLVSYVDSGSTVHGGRRWHWIAMELLTGLSLREELEAAGGRLMPARALQLAQQIALGLAALHDVNIVHRDVKPENVFVCADGTVKLLHFGVARFLDYSSLTQDGRFIGTLWYAAPEQLRGPSHACIERRIQRHCAGFSRRSSHAARRDPARARDRRRAAIRAHPLRPGARDGISLPRVA